jgi:hypothetical protein
LSHVGARRDVWRYDVEHHCGGGAVSDVNDLERSHQLVDAKGAIRESLRPTADLEEVSTGDTVFPALIYEDHHLRFLQLLAANAAEQRAANAIGNRHGTGACSG